LLWQKIWSKLHVLHISTAEEVDLFENNVPLEQKRLLPRPASIIFGFLTKIIRKGNFIKWNPAIKTSKDRDRILQGVLEDRIDVIATDHAPHTLEEKSRNYISAPSGGPLVQHSLVAMLDLYHAGKIKLEQIVQKMCHNVAILFEIEKRGYIRPGYHADLVIADLNSPWKVEKSNILSKCGWSPFEDHIFQIKDHTHSCFRTFGLRKRTLS
jgi:dihydroorotase